MEYCVLVVLFFEYFGIGETANKFPPSWHKVVSVFFYFIPFYSNTTWTWLMSNATTPRCIHLTTMVAVYEQNESTVGKLAVTFPVLFSIVLQPCIHYALWWQKQHVWRVMTWWHMLRRQPGKGTKVHLCFGMVWNNWPSMSVPLVDNCV